MRQKIVLDEVARRVRNQMDRKNSLEVGDIVLAGRKAEKVERIQGEWLQVADIWGNQRIINGSGVHKASELEALLFKEGAYSELPPAQVVAWMKGHPDDPRNEQMKKVWRLVAAKFEAQDPNKFNWGGAVMYFRNKANKMGVDMPPELMGRVQGKPKAIPKPNEQVEDWARENQVSKKVINDYVNQRAALERQLDEAQRGLAGLAPIEAKIMPMLKEVKGQQMKVKNLILKYAKTPITTMDYEKAFSMALEKVAQDERDFVRGYILGQLNKGDIEKMLIEKKQSKEAGLGSWLAGIAAKIMNWLSSYRRNVAMLEKAVD